jgi:hypothetical protein
LRHRRFFSLGELNAAIRVRLDELNDRRMRGWGTPIVSISKAHRCVVASSPTKAPLHERPCARSPTGAHSALRRS